MMVSARVTCDVIGSPIDVIGWDEVNARVGQWAAARDSRYVCITNVHSVVTASTDAAFARVLREADMATPDGAPVAWMIRRMGHEGQQRINGPDLMGRLCEWAAASGTPVFLLGSTPETLASLVRHLSATHPALQIAGHHSPPFRAPTDAEDAELVAQVNNSGARLLFVSLGCPKQETWMAAHRGRVQAVMFGLGAAFDFHAGTIQRAPRWMRDAGLEWLHRLLSEPRRLWKRYLVTNTQFIVKASLQLLRKPV